MKPVIIKHIRYPLYRYTVSVKPVRQWVERTCEGRVLNLFAGQTLLAIDEVRNDPDPAMPAGHHVDAHEMLYKWKGEMYGTNLLDPPYTYRKSMELYKAIVCSTFRKLKNAIPKILLPGGLAVTFGYHSMAMGAGRYFRLEQLAVFSHGGAIRDTIASVKRFRPP